jgi:hypothetical protein
VLAQRAEAGGHTFETAEPYESSPNSGSGSAELRH